MLNSDKLDILENKHDKGKIQTLDQLFSKHNPSAVDLLKKMLIVDPTKRISIAEALEHPFLAEFHDSEDEPVTDKLDTYDFDFEYYELSNEQLKDLLYDEIMLYHDETLLEAYIQDKEANPQGSVGARFGINHQGRPQETTPKEFVAPELDLQN